MILGKVDKTRLGAQHFVCDLRLFERPRIRQRPTLYLTTVANCVGRRHHVVRAVTQTRSHFLVQIGFLVRIVARIEGVQITRFKTAGLLNALTPLVLLRLFSRLVLGGLRLWCLRGHRLQRLMVGLWLLLQWGVVVRWLLAVGGL
ncbi:hypothetical protein C1S80_19280 [Mycolicibacterium aubagnense]|nr:hypothetical protein C1S80_19280 [Mycolicibacterium aubagnense]